MRMIGNILWFIFGGFAGGLAWLLVGAFWCVTIVGIPVGLQCFKMAALSFWPFGKEVIYSDATSSFLLNLLWLLFSGWMLALGHLISGLLLTITIIGIPFAKQSFKLARLSLMPFGARVVRVN